MIRSFSVKGLHDKLDYDFSFYPDLNVFTGRNGSGKTTLLKLLWYMISPNLERTAEIRFRHAEVVTDDFRIAIDRGPADGKTEFVFSDARADAMTVVVPETLFHDRTRMDDVESINQRIIALDTSSIFFPTFRRIEGGFSIDEPGRSVRPSGMIGRNVNDAISAYAATIGVNRHRFVASISTDDIEQLLTSQYADISERTNDLHIELSKFISNTVPHETERPDARDRQVDVEELVAALDQLSKIRRKVASVDSRRAALMRPFDVLSELISEIFKDKGIKVSSNLTFGKAKEAIRASILSAGEKQMLSFLCYNAFASASPIFIDEPEISLHGDWQRILFQKLLSQGTSNQFFITTHSPFIYSRYPEREFQLNADRGDIG